MAQAAFELQLPSSSRLARCAAGMCMWLHSVGQPGDGADCVCVNWYYMVRYTRGLFFSCVPI